MSRRGDTAGPPDGMGERPADWHLARFIEFTRLKARVGEPSPHLAIVGWLSRDSAADDRLWLLGCYAATYCLPAAQVIWEEWPHARAEGNRSALGTWLKDNWPGVITRTERRCVRTPAKMTECLHSYLDWVRGGYPALLRLAGTLPDREYYDAAWESVGRIKFFGRYINIRLIEGLRRYCGIPARLYDIRSIGGWSPKKALCYLYPGEAGRLLVNDAAGNELTDRLAYRLLARVRRSLPDADEYVLAAMLCEYKGAFEKRHQYPGWTIDQEPLLYDKVRAYWGDVPGLKGLWAAREALFPPEALGEVTGGWRGTRWDCAGVLRDYGYNWSDLRYDYAETRDSGDFSRPRARGAAGGDQRGRAGRAVPAGADTDVAAGKEVRAAPRPRRKDGG
jgi:hypothetical protein